jgi:hypothetical protein
VINRLSKELTDRCVHTELLLEFSSQALFRGLTVLKLTTRELPLAGKVVRGLTLRNEDLAIFDQDSGSYGNDGSVLVHS